MGSIDRQTMIQGGRGRDLRTACEAWAGVEAGVSGGAETVASTYLLLNCGMAQPKARELVIKAVRAAC